MQRGLTIIYWGYGKGKTTAAMGAAFRALGQGLRVLIVQFMKGGGTEGWKTGEQLIFDALNAHGMPVQFIVAGKGWVKIMGDEKPFANHEQAARDGLAYGKAQMAKNNWDLLVLDEILSAVDSALLTLDDIKTFLSSKPSAVHLIMTGHKEYPELAHLADLITKMDKQKHPFDKGIKALKGIDF